MAARHKHRPKADAAIVIVGAGLAGLYTALKLAPLPVTVVAAAPLGEGASSVWAQGGVAAAVGEGDTAEAHAADTVAAGAGIVDPAVALTIAREARACILDLADLGVPFDRSASDGFVLSREAAHSAHRVVRVSGDRAGAAIMATLVQKARTTPSIRLVEGYTAVHLVRRDGLVAGVAIEPVAGGERLVLAATHVVLATGGAGGLYATTTNPPIARGEGFAIAARAGATIADAEFVQFHPTAIDSGAVASGAAIMDPAPLASEALRGEGATLLDRTGRRFMLDADPRAELAPRDVVARAVFASRAAGRGAFLDCRTAIGDRFATAFPTIYASCRALGIDPARDLIPVAPAAHYHMGGIATDLRGRSTVAGLWAVGECASTGLHGANRLASNSLLEAVVMGARVAADIGRLVDGRRMVQARAEPVACERGLSSARTAAILAALRTLMDRYVGVVRDADGLSRAKLAIHDMVHEAGHLPSGTANALIAARFVVEGAIARVESRGGHFRSDAPTAVPALAVRSMQKLTADGRVIPVAPAKPASERAGIAAPFLPLAIVGATP
jgi:L-aspartate oxidase